MRRAGRTARLLLPLTVVLLVLTIRPATAQTDAIQLVGQPGEQNNFPDGMVFTVEAQSSAEIREVRFRYTFLPESRSSSANAEFDPGNRVKATFNLRSATGTRYLPPGKRIRYTWEIRDVAGNELVVPQKDTSFADPRFSWKNATEGNVTVNYYAGGERDAEVLALVARETIDKAAALMGTSLDFPIQIWAYANRRDFQIALAHESVASDPGVLGQAHEPDIFIMVVDRLSSPSALDTARHELTHLVTARAVAGGPYSGLYPSWLNEGTSVYMQVSPNDVGYIDSLNKAIKDDKVIPLKSLTAGTRNRDVGLFYGEGYSVVKYLVDKFGADKFAAMIVAFNKTGQLDEAFKQVFGTDVDGIYKGWRESVGLSADQRTVATTTPDDVAARPAQSSDSGSNEVVWIAIASTLMVLLLGAAVAGGVLLARRARSA